MGDIALGAGKGASVGLQNLTLGSVLLVAAALLLHNPAWGQSTGTSSVITLGIGQ